MSKVKRYDGIYMVPDKYRDESLVLASDYDDLREELAAVKAELEETQMALANLLKTSAPAISRDRPDIV